MEEELNENELEDRFYAMLHHVDETQPNFSNGNQNQSDATHLVENGPRSTMRRYWRTSADYNPYSKTNTPKDPPSAPVSVNEVKTNNNPDPKKEKSPSPNPLSTIDLLKSPVPQNIKKTIEILDIDSTNPVVLESSDEDEVVEVALPPKPTITIESSDEDELIVMKIASPNKEASKAVTKSAERPVSASPVPSVVSSVSDDFIHSDCIALNISSKHPDKHSFDFSLHGPDLLVQNTPSKKKKKKKSKSLNSSTPINTSGVETFTPPDSCFATPKSKANKKQRTELLTQTEKEVSNPEIYDSDSNQSIIDLNKNKNTYVVTEKSLPNADVYESDSNQSEIAKENGMLSKTNCVADSCDSSVSSDPLEDTLKRANHDNSVNKTVGIVDLTGNDYITLDASGFDSINESIVIGNVSGFTNFNDNDDNYNVLPTNNDISKYVSSKVPSILNEDLDFDNLKGKEKVCRRRQYSLTTLRAEMQKFYNESWGGEDFNHREIQKNMSRDKSLWAIDPKDKLPTGQRRMTCNYCNRPGHRDDTCRQKPPVCYMCGNIGHYEPRCPSKICVNCGNPNHMYSTMCRNCCSWGNLTCAECGQHGHPASHCPDSWRRYHNTLDIGKPLEMSLQTKKHHQLFCSGCSKRGHLVHTCRCTLPFSGLMINSPYVCVYRPIFTETDSNNHKPRSKSFSQDHTTPNPNAYKRYSKSPTVHEMHVNKKRNTDDEPKRINTQKPPKSMDEVKQKSVDDVVSSTEKAPDFIPIGSTNHDKKGHVIQDNEVSDTSDVVTSARISVTDVVAKKLKAKEGEDWLKAVTTKLDVIVEPTNVHSFLNIKGKLLDQEAFQSELRQWTQDNFDKTKSNSSQNGDSNKDKIIMPPSSQNVPKNRKCLLKKLSCALRSLQEDLGDPRALYKKLTYSQNYHEKLIKCKVVSPKALGNSRMRINNLLKLLNTILLGQAGLADGSEHVNELYSIHKKLMKLEQETVSSEFRSLFGEHFNSIFSSHPRDDYLELMKNYYSPWSAINHVAKKKKKQHNSNKSFPNMNDINNSIPTQQNNGVETEIPTQEGGDDNNAHINRLISCRNKIKKIRPKELFHKRKKHMILQKCNESIISLNNKEYISNKHISKIQRQARKFLASVEKY